MKPGVTIHNPTPYITIPLKQIAIPTRGAAKFIKTIMSKHIPIISTGYTPANHNFPFCASTFSIQTAKNAAVSPNASPAKLSISFGNAIKPCTPPL